MKVIVAKVSTGGTSLVVVIILILGLVIDARTTKLPSFILLLLIRVRSRFIIDAVSAFLLTYFLVC